ncbi:hypothetical protein DF185_15410 [Marinifilum breve]|uniref:Esterase n=1 Tax=Marinifilum breve TaxID=2184082 RepID=A0A2V3ZX71_9BACT|nr:alpha/beta hydrolase-fold protein [Marinifilum breve]PXX98765.1 hypothetical protein DF185_15410 [Marinifilum breve]
MKKAILLLLALIPSQIFSQQTLVKIFKSEVLNENRTIRIHLPKSYDSSNVNYPLAITLDGEYMFYNLVGNAELLLANNKIPEMVIVGIDQNYKDNAEKYARWQDCNYNSETTELKDKGVNFEKFINTELISYLSKNYKAGKYKILAGHSLTASYSNFLLSNKSAFNAFILLSPYMPASLSQKVSNNLWKTDKNLSYYISTSDYDLRGHSSSIAKFDSLLHTKQLDPKVTYTINKFKKETHYSLINRSFPKALMNCFQEFQLITDDELENEKDLLAYLKNKYTKIKQLYDLSLPIRKDDIESIYWIAEDREDWNLLKRIGDFSIELYPDYADGYFMLSTVEEQNQNYEMALQLYKKGYDKLGDDVLNKSDFYRDIERLEKIMKESK